MRLQLVAEVVCAALLGGAHWKLRLSGRLSLTGMVVVPGGLGTRLR